MWLLAEDFELEKSESEGSGGWRDSYKELIGMEGVKIAALAFKNDPIFPLFKVFTRSHRYTQAHKHISTTKMAM
jgi:hypothetical protein